MKALDVSMKEAESRVKLCEEAIRVKDQVIWVILRNDKIWDHFQPLIYLIHRIKGQKWSQIVEANSMQYALYILL